MTATLSITTGGSVSLRVSKQRGGFTLIEVLIVLMLMTLLFGAMFGTYIQIRDLIQTQSNASNRSEKIMHVVRTLTLDIRNLRHEKWNEEQIFRARKEVIGGSRIDRLSLPSGRIFANASTYQTNAFQVSWFGETDTDTGEVTIYRQETMFPQTAGSGIPVSMAEGVKKFQIEFSLNGRDYFDEWDYSLRKTMPRLIRVTIEWEENRQTRKYTFELRPPVLWN